ncbi:sulfotransferase isoform A [Chlorella sorokiniana]|uniref:7,8-dihydroneopterin aldolase n=1 Tax=Chlorella sorokiniana TaxID=3076 RepID=A0A2P6TQ05_CHLSO|nr:sulfotransferase isoform B [Chlorella sorokiniana]PRW56117.1 sulfotransferase isoform A [Chlorella sorokiniana]|eukprot:PRW56116.1 sulfotransferase isoform B [Chlorella sorokiniana]
MGAWDSAPPAIQRMVHALSLQESEEGRIKGYEMQPRSGDVFIASPPKCGTTWVCQLVQTLRSRGDMSFEEINLVIPCIEMAWDGGYKDLQAPQPWSPRVFKTHIWYPDCPKAAGVKYIFVVRDPQEAAPSFFHFLCDWTFDAGDISLDQFVTQFFLKRGAPASRMENAGMLHNMASWYQHRADPSVLWLHYEDLHEDLPAAVRLLAGFLGIGACDAELQALAVQQGSIDFMKQFPEKYDEHMLKAAMNVNMGRPPDAGMQRAESGSKVREGRVGSNSKQLGEAARAAIHAKWQEVMAPVTGCSSYQEMRRSINRELRRPFLYDGSSAVRLTPSGVRQVFATNCNGTSLYTPVGAAVLSTGEVWVGTLNTSPNLFKFAADGTCLLSMTVGRAAGRYLAGPDSSGNVYFAVADILTGGTTYIYKITPSGTVSTFISNTEWNSAVGSFNSDNPVAMYVDAVNGLLFVGPSNSAAGIQRWRLSDKNRATINMGGYSTTSWYGVGTDGASSATIYASMSDAHVLASGSNGTAAVTDYGATALGSGSSFYVTPKDGFIYGNLGRFNLSAGSCSYERLLWIYSGALGLAVSSTGFFIPAYGDSTQIGMLIWGRPSTSSSTGVETLVLARDLTLSGTGVPSQACGEVGGKVYLITDAGTKITSVDITTRAVTTVITGLTRTVACTFDIGGSGDLVFGDADNVIVAPAASLAGSLPIARSSLTPKFSVGATGANSTTITGLAATTGSTHQYFVFKAGIVNTGSTVATPGTVVRVDAASTPTTTTLWASVTLTTGLKFPATSAPYWFGGTLALTTDGTLYLTKVLSDNFMYTLASAGTATSNSTATPYGATSGTNFMKSNIYIASSGTAVYTTCSKDVYQACISEASGSDPGVAARSRGPLAAMLLAAARSLLPAQVPAAVAVAIAATAGRRLFSSDLSGLPHDKILLRGLVFHGYHGVLPEENRLGQKFVVDATLFTDLSHAGKSDDLRRTVNYAQVYESIQEIVEGPPQQLIEAVAERIAGKVLGEHPGVAAITVRVAKPHVAVPGVLHSLGVEITRRRQEAEL